MTEQSRIIAEEQWKEYMKLKEQLEEANEVIESLRTYDFISYCEVVGSKGFNNFISLFQLKEQLEEANEVIESLRTYDFTVADENAESYQVKWNVKAERFYKNKKWG